MRVPSAIAVSVFWSWLFVLPFVSGCDHGLTQLRFRQSLELMLCTPVVEGFDDPCRALAGGANARCQYEASGDYHVCCGSPQLLFELLTGSASTNSLVWQALHMDMERFAKLHNPIPENEPEEIRIPMSTLPPEKLVKAGRGQRTIESAMEGKRVRIGPSRIAQKSAAYVVENGPVLSMLVEGNFVPSAGSPSTYSAPASVALLQDGDCSIVVNTGLPMQRNAIRSALVAHKLLNKRFNFTVTTAAQPQFVGNLNLFASDNLVLEGLVAAGTKLSPNPLRHSGIVKLCSPNTIMIATPGPSDDAITVLARNVPSMGTVALTGSLFLQDDRLDRVDSVFVSDVAKLFESRKTVVCQADWLVPAHGGPIPVSRKLKLQAGC